MSKCPVAKRHHYEAARFSGPKTTKETKQKKRRTRNENDTTTNEKPSDVDS